MTKLRILFRTGDSIEFPVKDRAAADLAIKGHRYDGTICKVENDGKLIASWLQSECVAMVVQESGGK